MPKLHEIRAGILIHYNDHEQNLEIVERMRAESGNQGIILEWPNIEGWSMLENLDTRN
jgi:hypothetical protein